MTLQMLSLVPVLAQTDEVQSAAEGSLQVFGDVSLADPWFLGALPFALLAFAWGRARSGRPVGRVSALPGIELPRSLRQRTAWIPGLLQILALCTVVVALARPLRGSVEEATVSEGVDIALVLDRSSSMDLPDLVEDKDVRRFDIVKEVVEDFAIRRMTDREGNADNVALIPFAGYPQVLCPFTLDVDALRNFLRPLDTAETGTPEDGTAIGVALAKAVAVLKETDARSKIVVLLTDGENRENAILPEEGADLAAAENIRVYTIMAARYVWARDPFNGTLRPTNQQPDTSELELIAERTGGRFFRARDRAELEEIYTEIERLERTPREDRRYTENFDLYPPLLAAALALYLGAWCLGSTWGRRLP